MLKRKGDIMSVFRVKKNNNYTVMANYHLRDKELSFKAKGLLSYMLSLPEDWDYSLNGLASVSKEGIKVMKNIISELKGHGYLKINKIRKENGQYQYEYLIREIPEGIEPEYPKGYAIKGESEKSIQINTNKQKLNYNKLFNKLLEEYNYEDLIIITWYIADHIVKRKFLDEEGNIIENKFGYFKSSVYNNINKLINNEIEIDEEICWFKDEIDFY